MRNIKCLPAVLMISIALVFGFQITALGSDKINFAFITADQVHEPGPMIIKEKKFLEDEGIEVNWLQYMSGAYLVQHFASGEVDVGTCGAVPGLIAASSGINVVMIAGSNAEGVKFVVHDYIKTPKDLDGKKIATGGAGTIPALLLDIIERKHNVKAQRKSVSLPDSPIYFRKKEVDGVLLPEPFPSKAISVAGTGHVLMESKDILPGHQCCVLLATGKMIKERPELVRKVMRAYKRALEYIIKHPDEVRGLMTKYSGVDREVVEKSFPCVVYQNPPFINVESLKYFAESLQKEDKITKDAFTDVDKWVKTTYDHSFVNEIWK